MALLLPIQEIQKSQNKILNTVVENQKKVMAAIEELQSMLAQQTKANFQIKGSSIEVMGSFHSGFCIQNYLIRYGVATTQEGDCHPILPDIEPISSE